MGFNVLIVDDSEITRSALARMLELAGVPLGTVSHAGDGRRALEVLDESWVDVVLMDLNMPGMGGTELLERMDAAGILDHTPVVVISSERRQERIDALRRRGVRAFITKPLRPELLRDVVLDLLEVNRG